jgi:hypothetical protein
MVCGNHLIRRLPSRSKQIQNTEWLCRRSSWTCDHACLKSKRLVAGSHHCTIMRLVSCVWDKIFPCRSLCYYDYSPCLRHKSYRNFHTNYRRTALLDYFINIFLVLLWRGPLEIEIAAHAISRCTMYILTFLLLKMLGTRWAILLLSKACSRLGAWLSFRDNFALPVMNVDRCDSPKSYGMEVHGRFGYV